MQKIIGTIAMRSPSGDILPAQPIWQDITDEEAQASEAAEDNTIGTVLMPQLAEYYKTVNHMEGVAPAGD